MKSEAQKRWWVLNREDQLRKMKAYRERTKPERMAAMKAWRARNKDKMAAAARRRAYGITAEDFAAMLVRQNGRCAICRATEPGGSGGWHLDHDHRFDAKDARGHRGLLCFGCNRALGQFRDDHRIISAAADYLQDHALKLKREHPALAGATSSDSEQRPREVGM